MMQKPEMMDKIRNLLLDRNEKDWPDRILLASLPQVPDTELDAPIQEIIGRCEGKVRNTGEVTLESQKEGILYKHPKGTKFVRVIRDGMEFMERWNFAVHGEWEAIPDTELTPTEMLYRIYGFGETEIEHGQQFQRERKKRGGASKTDWKPRHYPKPDVQQL